MATQLALASRGHKMAHQATLNNGRKHRLNIGYTLSPRSHLSHHWVTNTVTMTLFRCESSPNNNEIVTSILWLKSQVNQRFQKRKMVPGGGDYTPCKHHTYTAFEAIFRFSLTMQHVKCITLVYPVVYPNVCHMMCLQSSY